MLKNLSFLIIILSCFNSCIEHVKTHGGLNKEQQRAFDKISEFENHISELHTKSESQPDKVLKETQSLINQTLNSSDSLNIARNKLDYLFSLRAEIFYKTEQYQNSIDEIIANSEIHLKSSLISSHDNLVLACNYVKLKKYKIAFEQIEKAGKGYYITDYILGNFYENTEEIGKAKEIYLKIIREERSHYKFYELAQNRLTELEKESPKLLTELYFPTYNPKFKITK